MSEQDKEFFYKDKGGKPQDKDLHEPILSGIDRDAEARARNIARKRPGAPALTEVEIKKLYADVTRRQKGAR
jgi:hypothetical protein